MAKNFEDMCNRLHTIPACDGRTDRQTDILPQHSPRYAYASRGKKCDYMKVTEEIMPCYEWRQKVAPYDIWLIGLTHQRLKIIFIARHHTDARS